MIKKLPLVVLFDLDGTLLNTAPEFLSAINKTRLADGLSPMLLEQIKPLISKGSEAIISKAYKYKLNSREFRERHQRFLLNYWNVLGDEAVLFNGMSEVLETIESSGRVWGIVTNKPSKMTAPLLKKLNLFDRAACVVSGDTTSHPKPHPAPILKACSIIGQQLNDCIYIGDDQRDIVAASAAGVRSIIALYGYMGSDDQPNKWGASTMIEQPSDLIPALKVAPFSATQK